MTEQDCAHDVALCNRVWQRVAPEENPYPMEELLPTKQAWQELLAQLSLLRYCLRQGAQKAPQTKASQLLRRMAGETDEIIRRTQAICYVIEGEVRSIPLYADKSDRSWRELLGCCCRETEKAVKLLQQCRQNEEVGCYEMFLEQMQDKLYRQMRQILHLLENTIAK